MKVLKSYSQFIQESHGQAAQGLIDKLKSEANSAKMRTGGSVDKLPWAMAFVVMNAAVAKLQDDLAKGLFNGVDPMDQYKENFYKAIDTREEELEDSAIDVLTQNGLNPSSVESLKKETVEVVHSKPKPPAPAPVAAPAQPALPPPTPTPTLGPGSPQDVTHQMESLNINEGWQFKKLKSNQLNFNKVRAGRSPLQKAYHSAFNHMRNLIRKYLV